MTALTRWTGDGLAVMTGTATFTHGERVLEVRLQSFADAKALDELIDLVALRGRRAARAACASYMRAAATQLEHAE